MYAPDFLRITSNDLVSAINERIIPQIDRGNKNHLESIKRVLLDLLNSIDEGTTSEHIKHLIESQLNILPPATEPSTKEELEIQRKFAFFKQIPMLFYFSAGAVGVGLFGYFVVGIDKNTAYGTAVATGLGYLVYRYAPRPKGD